MFDKKYYEYNELGRNPKLDEIIINSEFKVLGFGGEADGATPLVQGFDPNIISNKSVLIKGIQIVPYMDAAAVDFIFSDGTTETIPAGLRINRLFDAFSDAGGVVVHTMRFLLNGSSVIFSTPNFRGCPPPDFQIDNIYYLFKEKLQTMEFIYGAENSSDLAGLSVPVFVKVYVECYLF